LSTSLRILITDLACARGERLLFSGLTCAISSSETLLITGPNGIGKTTLLRALGGFLPTAQGRVVLEGAGPEMSLGESAHFLGHRDGLRGALTVRENLALAPAIMSGSGVSVTDAAARLRLEPLLDLPVSVLSAGQRRRTALARLLVAKRPIWLLDEPTAALDSASTTLTTQLIAEHVASGGLVIAATHLPLGLARQRELQFAADGTHQLIEAAS
jgi:heme exporter protein A